ncbi:ABC transporter ATP-binding protein [bacterium 1XD42-8]|nr:ABC transporter ATP-binding protein [bacterium 1XD42-8]
MAVKERDRDKNFSIIVNNISKIYNLYEKPSDRLKEVMSPRHKCRHNEHYALKDISFQVARGETFGIVGPNGAGKSTLLKLLTGVATPSKGLIQVDGKIAALLELGAGFNREYTGLENIYLNGTMMGFTRKEMEQRVKGILEFADIGEFINQPVKTYSSGMFARLAFSVAIYVEPEILIVDEALSVGDVFFQNKCYRKFRDLRRDSNTTIIFVSHDIETVKQLCSRALWIEYGIQQMIGNSVEVCNAYTNSILKKNGIQKREGRKELEKTYPLKEYDVQKFPPVSYAKESILSKDIQILSCFVENSSHEIVVECEILKEYTVVIIFQSKIDIPQGIVGFVLETVKGLWVVNCNSMICDNKANIPIKANSINKVEFTFVMPPLMNGDYILGPAISEGDMGGFHVHTWLYNVGKIKITKNPNNSALIDVNAKIQIYQSGDIVKE